MQEKSLNGLTNLIIAVVCGIILTVKGTSFLIRMFVDTVMPFVDTMLISMLMNAV